VRRIIFFFKELSRGQQFQWAVFVFFLIYLPLVSTTMNLCLFLATFLYLNLNMFSKEHRNPWQFFKKLHLRFSAPVYVLYDLTGLMLLFFAYYEADEIPVISRLRHYIPLLDPIDFLSGLWWAWKSSRP